MSSYDGFFRQVVGKDTYYIADGKSYCEADHEYIWKGKLDKASGKTYFVNKKTNERKWKLPGVKEGKKSKKKKHPTQDDETGGSGIAMETETQTPARTLSDDVSGNNGAGMRSPLLEFEKASKKKLKKSRSSVKTLTSGSVSGSSASSVNSSICDELSISGSLSRVDTNSFHSHVDPEDASSLFSSTANGQTNQKGGTSSGGMEASPGLDFSPNVQSPSAVVVESSTTRVYADTSTPSRPIQANSSEGMHHVLSGQLLYSGSALPNFFVNQPSMVVNPNTAVGGAAPPVRAPDNSTVMEMHKTLSQASSRSKDTINHQDELDSTLALSGTPASLDNLQRSDKTSMESCAKDSRVVEDVQHLLNSDPVPEQNASTHTSIKSVTKTTRIISDASTPPVYTTTTRTTTTASAAAAAQGVNPLTPVKRVEVEQPFLPRHHSESLITSRSERGDAEQCARGALYQGTDSVPSLYSSFTEHSLVPVHSTQSSVACRNVSISAKTDSDVGSLWEELEHLRRTQHADSSSKRDPIPTCAPRTPLPRCSREEKGVERNTSVEPSPITAIKSHEWNLSVPSLFDVVCKAQRTRLAVPERLDEEKIHRDVQLLELEKELESLQSRSLMNSSQMTSIDPNGTYSLWNDFERFLSEPGTHVVTNPRESRAGGDCAIPSWPVTARNRRDHLPYGIPQTTTQMRDALVRQSPGALVTAMYHPEHSDAPYNDRAAPLIFSSPHIPNPYDYGFKYQEELRMLEKQLRVAEEFAHTIRM